MIYSIINNLLPYFTTLNFADRVAGIAYGVELPIMTEDNQTVLKRFPVIENLNKNQCDGNDYVSLVPDDSLKSLIYHELISDRIDEDNDSYQQHTATVRLVAWFNLRNINEHLTNCEQLLQLINNKIPFQIADFSTAYRITCETTDKRIRDKSIFSQWTYSESEKQYLIYPFDFGHLTLQISYRLNKCAEDIVLDPNACNDLKAKPFATVYDKTNVIELYAGETHTCEACSTAPVLVKDSAGTLLYTKNAGETATITDVIVKNSANVTILTIKAQAAPSTLPDITVTENDGTISTYPACQNIIAKVIMIPKKLTTGALVAGVLKTIPTGMTYDNYIMQLSEADNIVDVEILRQTPATPKTHIDVQTSISIPGGLTLKIIGFNN
jgi:hypothetical protein